MDCLMSAINQVCPLNWLHGIFEGCAFASKKLTDITLLRQIVQSYFLWSILYLHGYQWLILKPSICTNVKNSVFWGTSIFLPAKNKKGKRWAICCHLKSKCWGLFCCCYCCSFHFFSFLRNNLALPRHLNSVLNLSVVWVLSY